MTFKKALIGAGLVFLVFFILGISSAATGFPSDALAASGRQSGPAAQPTLSPDQQKTDEAVRSAFQSAVDQNRSLVLGFQIYGVVIDHIQYSTDGTRALLWLALRDRQTGEIVATEPGLSIATLASPAAPGATTSWSILLPASADFIDQLRALPAELLTQDVRQRFLEGSQSLGATTAQALPGYKLPWTAGLTKYMTNSIGHVYSVSGGLTSCPSSCLYAFDFADGTMFPLLAAKGGTVKAWKTTCPNYGESCTNYLVLEDQSTIPTSYQLYYHMANESVPQRLRQVGAVVSQGEYIGDADDTGASTGHHLHFHVYTIPTGANWSWGSSVDITFDDVPVNNGRPRTCAESSEYPGLGSQCLPSSRYTSGNTPAHPPSGSLDLPADHQVITSRTLHVQGSASDDIQITRIQVVANYDGSWKTIDDIIPNSNGPYAKDVDLCSAGVPDGPLSLTVRIYDREGSQARNIPVRQMIKNYSCSGPVQPPVASACAPSADQVALYADADFRGACQKFNVSNNQGYTAELLGAVGDNQAASIQVGNNVRAVLYDRSADVPAARPLGRIETFDASDASLSDNRIGIDQASGLWVVSRAQAPGTPFLKPVGNRLAASSPSSLDSLVLAWDGGKGASSFDVRLDKSGSGTLVSKTTTGNSLSVGNLAAGDYALSVTARNSLAASTSTSFSVTSASFPAAAAKTAPYQYDMEAGASGWTASGLWRLGAITTGNRAATNAWLFNNGTSYADATYRAGDLTSPPITLPASGTYYLRFSYYMDTEDGNTTWDQRRVQVSQKDGAVDGPFEDLFQLSGDKQVGQVWLSSGPVSLQRFAGKTIRLRFHFDAIDEERNSGLGWAVDDVSVLAQGPSDTACIDNNDSPETAQPLTVGNMITAAICPERDLDYYKIDARAGQPVKIDINARALAPSSRLDSYVYLLDGDGRSVLAENDDEVYIQKVDSLLPYTFTRDGTYYIKVKAWNYPGVGSPDFFYQLDLRQDTPMQPRSVTILYPKNNQAPTIPFDIEASAVDFDGGPVARVEFFWHGPDSSQGWASLGADTDGADGWSYRVDPGAYGGTTGSALYVQAVSRTGGVLGQVLWDLASDVSIPVSQMNPLPPQIKSTAIHLTWTAADGQDDIDHFEVDYQVVSGGSAGAWQHWNGPFLAGSLRSSWFIGAPGQGYNFRLRAVDQAGNAEPFPNGPEASTTLAAACLPDAHEGGQSADSSFTLPSTVVSPSLNVCKSQQDGSGDVDWFVFQGLGGEELLLMVIPQNEGGAKLQVSLYGSDSTLYGTWQPPDYGQPASIRWTPPATGDYYLEVKPVNPGLFGTDMTYQVWEGPGTWVSLPLISR